MTDGTTHAEGCWTWGPKHYACALERIARLEALLPENQPPHEHEWTDHAHCKVCGLAYDEYESPQASALADECPCVYDGIDGNATPNCKDCGGTGLLPTKGASNG